MQPLRFAQLDTMLGPMLVAWSEAGLAALRRGTDLPTFLAALRRRSAAWAIEPGADAGHVAHQLGRYLAGSRRTFDLALDLTGIAAFDSRVYAAARAIRYGTTATYGELAARIGSPGAARAVGGAMSRCPFSPVVPCHRVVRASDGFSGWGPNPSVKRWLLELERGNRVASGERHSGDRSTASRAWRLPPQQPRAPGAPRRPPPGSSR